MITTHVTRVLSIPHEPGETMTLRMLSWVQLQAARDARQAAALRGIRDLGVEMFGQLQQQASGIAAEGEADPLAGFDTGVLLRAGIAGWSYPDAVTPEAIDALDAETSTWAARALLDLRGQRTEDERLKG